MFGSGLPVCQVWYNCIDELVDHGKNGCLFKDAKELTGALLDLLRDFPDQDTGLGAMRRNLDKFRARKWEQEWLEVAAGPLRAAVGGAGEAAAAKKAR